MEFKNLHKNLEESLNRVISNMESKIKGTNLADNIKLIDGGDGLYSIEMPQYGIYVHSGRKPGKMPPISALKEWASARNIPESALYPIAKKIGEEGTEPQPFLDELYNDKLIHKSVADGIIDDILNSIDDI